MGRLVPAVVALLLALPPGSAAAAPARRSGRAQAEKAQRAPTLAEASAALKALERDGTKRRYRHHWERVIRTLERAARGDDAPRALLEAARARQALYRWSSLRSDRDAALRLADRAAKLGSRDALALAVSLRREAGAAAHGQPTPAARAAGSPGRALAQASAAMKAVQRDRTKRRYRHHWERAIRNLERAARGADAERALLEAARARYALYRWSAVESDRDAALRLSARAAKLGSHDASALAAAIRREAGDEARPPRRVPAVAGAPAPGREAVAAAAEEEEAEDAMPEPALQAALADGSASDGPHALALGDSGGEGKARVSEIKTWSSGDYTRVAVYLSHWVGWQKLELAPAAGLPRRLALDFRPAELAGEAVARPVAGEQVDRMRAAQNDPETVRVVLDLPGQENVQLFGLDDPPRLVIDVGAVRSPAPRGGGDVAAAEPPASAPAPVATSFEVAPSPAQRHDEEDSGFTGPVRRIVVDAGHGGRDPGAIGPRRVREKDVTLQMAKRLARKLRAAGFEVVLTRDRDRYLALEERTAIANTARGDLFVSIHANAHPRRNREGVETYYLNVADDRYAARLAARENGLDPGEGEGVLTRILTDLETKASAGASRKLAQLVQREVTSGVRAGVGDVRDLGVKGALFYVLLGARMPAVLVETAFLSNRVEERRLASARYQDVVATGIARAVTAYARSEARVAAAR